MKIKSLRLQNFKRFTDLTLQDIPENVKLILLIGSNGSGKSSVFDAFEVINKRLKDDDRSLSFTESLDYYEKDVTKPFYIEFLADNSERKQYVGTNNGSITNSGNSFYGRSAVRYTPRIERTVIGNPINVSADGDRPRYYIDRENRFENDIDLLLSDIVKKVFSDLNNKTEGKIDEVKMFMRRLNDALSRIFSSSSYEPIKLSNFQTPADGKPAQLLFKKGGSEFNYDLLSAGEKEIINLLINLYTRTPFFKNTVYFFDELDAHLNTSLQYNLLKEITENWIPENCQIWTASHSLGFIQYASDSENGCIIDFDDLDFDKHQVLIPKQKNDFEIFEIAVSKAFIDHVVQGRRIIFSENTDTPFYNDLNITNTLFFVATDKMDVFHKAKNHKQFGLIDRDYLSDSEVIEIKKVYQNLYILPYYSFENLIYHPDNLEEYYASCSRPFHKQNYIDQLTKIKNDERDYLAAGIIQARGGYPFYKENEKTKQLKQFKENYREVIDLLRSDDFETYFKVFPAKDYGKEIPERLGLSSQKLSQTKWFKQQIENILK
ncbi:MAG: AAA family ATPase [Bacteroidetes bacterium]|nr:AAA family ATPase [Bacteroidota bacterium]